MMFYIALHGVIFKIAFKIVYFIVYSIIICLIKGRLHCVGQRLEWVVDTEKCPRARSNDQQDLKVTSWQISLTIITDRVHP